MRFPGLFEGIDVHVLPAGRLSGGPIGWARAAMQMWRGRAQAIRILKKLKPDAVIGFGGYPALTALLGERRGTDDVSIYAAPARATDLSGLPPAFIDCGSAEGYIEATNFCYENLYKTGKAH